MTGRIYHPTATDLAAWRKLVRKVRIIALNPTAPMGDMLAAAKAAAPRPVPSDDALTRFASPLVRLAQAWPAMDDATRQANAERLSWLAEGLSPLVGVTDRPEAPAPAPVQDRLRFEPPADEREAPRPAAEPRRDIFG